MKAIKTLLASATLAAIAASVPACAQGNPNTTADTVALFKAFTDSQSHCAALVDGRAGVVLDTESKSKPQDEASSKALKELLDSASTQQQRSSLVTSLLHQCAVRETVQ
jgi:hypothetical protein